MVSFTVRGRVMDILGYPIGGARIKLGTGYSIENGLESGISTVLAGPVTTSSNGRFQISISTQEQPIGLEADVPASTFPPPGC